MKVEIGYRPSQALARVVLEQNEGVIAESGAMVGMSTNVSIATRTGGFLSGLKRLLGSESLFVNTFTASDGRGEVLLAHRLPGDIVALAADERGVTVQAGAFLASSTNVTLETKVGGLKTLFAGEGFAVLRATSRGPGTLILGAFGGIEEMACDGDFVVDTGHLVAWDSTLTFELEKSAPGWLASWLSGEGLVCRFRGSGRIWVQSRHPGEYGKAMGTRLSARSN